MPRPDSKSQTGPARGVVITYTSLFLLLLTFFILLNSLGRVEETRLRAAYQSLQASFGFQEERRRPQGLLPSVTPLEQDYSSLRGLVEEESLSGDIVMLRATGQRTMAVSQAVLFGEQGDELSPRGREFLAQVARIIRDSGYGLTIAGHLDPEQAPGPGGEDALMQSGRRALAVLRLLQENGVSPARLTAMGFGGSRPLLPSSSAQHRHYNNRVELVLDAADASPSLLPEAPQAPRAEFRGFVFDLLPDQGK